MVWRFTERPSHASNGQTSGVWDISSALLRDGEEYQIRVLMEASSYGKASPAVRADTLWPP